MSGKEKKTLKFYFSTEGETEKWYLEHLQKLINNSEVAKCRVSFLIKTLCPVSFVKTISIIQKTRIFHFFDVESTENEYERRFKDMLEKMKTAEKKGKAVSYSPAYTNLTFELWLILHKEYLSSSITDRKNYLTHLNRIFGQKYQGLKEYKKEKNFKEILKKITLDDVKLAVKNAEKIMNHNKANYHPQKMYTFSWYLENPSTEVGTVIREILENCGILEKK